MKFNIFILTVLYLLITVPGAQAQFPVNTPECAVYDEMNDRYLISSWGTSSIISLSLDGSQSVFWQNDGSQVLSNCISGDTFFVSIDFNPGGVAAFDINTGNQLFELYIIGSTQLDGMAVDTSGYLYVGDMNQDRIYRIDRTDLSYESFAAGIAIDIDKTICKECATAVKGIV